MQQSTAVSAFGPWGLLLPGLACAGLVSWQLGRLVFAHAPRRERSMGGLVLGLSLLTAGMQVLLYAGLVWRGVVLGLLAAATIASSVWAQRKRAQLVVSGPEPWAWTSIPGLLVVLTGLGLLLTSVYFLPIWPWDSLGYHLTFVNFVLQGGGFAELPPDVPYLSTYPRNVELLFAGMRLLLPDDRLIDLGQIPLGIVGALATAAIARELGARRADALLGGAAWLLLPAVFLQLPTNYIDVGGAAFFLLASYFLLLEPTRVRLIAAGLAIGLFLGTKPSVPPAASLLAVVLVVRAVRAGQTRAAVLAVLCAGALGLEAYVEQLVRHGNPVWPAVVHIGPFELPGTVTVQDLLSSGAGAQKVHGPMPIRILKSWTTFDSLPSFDMRVGGLSPLFWLALVPATWLVVKNRLGTLACLTLIAVVTPDPAVVRYVFALPALVLGAAVAQAAHWPRRFEPLWHSALAILLGYNLYYAAPGLIGEGPPLVSYPDLTWKERAWIVGANGPPRDFVEAVERLAPGEVAVYDKALWLPYLMWRSDLENRAVRIPDGLSVEATQALLDAPGVRLIAAGNDQPAADVIAAQPERFTHLFDCPEPCKVYSRP